MAKSKDAAKKKAPHRRKVPVSRATQLRYGVIIGGGLFLYSLVLVLLVFFLEARAVEDNFLFSQAFRDHFVNFLQVMVFAIVSCFLIAFVLVDQFLRPYYQIKEKVFRLSEKNLTTRLDLIDNTDLQELSDEFNQFLDDFERMVLVLRLEQEEVSMILLKARQEAHLDSTRHILDKISRHNERIIDQLLSYRVIGDK